MSHNSQFYDHSSFIFSQGPFHITLRQDHTDTWLTFKIGVSGGSGDKDQPNAKMDGNIKNIMIVILTSLFHISLKYWSIFDDILDKSIHLNILYFLSISACHLGIPFDSTTKLSPSFRLSTSECLEGREFILSIALPGTSVEREFCFFAQR